MAAASDDFDVLEGVDDGEFFAEELPDYLQ